MNQKNLSSLREKVFFVFSGWEKIPNANSEVFILHSNAAGH